MSYVDVLRDKTTLHIRGHLLRLLDGILTILFGVYLVLWLF